MSMIRTIRTAFLTRRARNRSVNALYAQAHGLSRLDRLAGLA